MIRHLAPSRKTVGRPLQFLYYALGGGLGHAVRTIALARQIARHDSIHTIVTNTPFQSEIQKLLEQEKYVDRFLLTPIRLDSTAAASLAHIEQLASSINPDVFVVDTFPRGLGGELKQGLPVREGCLKVLISRSLPQSYVNDCNLGEFVSNHFDMVIAPGLPFGVGPGECVTGGHCPEFFDTSPFLIRDADELRNRKQAATSMNVDPSFATVLFVGTGSQKECLHIAKVKQTVEESLATTDIQFRLALPLGADGAGKPFPISPLIECLPAVDFVVGSAGYNLYWELQSLQIPSYLVTQNRKYDDQHQRCPVGFESFNIENIVGVINQTMTRRRCNTERPSANYCNGAADAGRKILANLDKTFLLTE